MRHTKNTLVTVDLDYWTILEKFSTNHTDYLKSLIDKTKSVKVISLHHHIVTKRMIPQDTDEVINIDFHNDIVDECPREDLNEGTWGNFLPRNCKKYTWVYPDEDMCVNNLKGICHGMTTSVPEIWHINYEKICGIENIKIDNISKLVICISKNWAEHDTTPYVQFLENICGTKKLREGRAA